MIRAIGEIICSAERRLWNVSHHRPPASAAGHIAPTMCSNNTFVPKSVADRQMHVFKKLQQKDTDEKNARAGQLNQRAAELHSIHDKNLFADPIPGSESKKKVSVEVADVAPGKTPDDPVARFLNSVTVSVQHFKARLEGFFNSIDRVDDRPEQPR